MIHFSGLTDEPAVAVTDRLRSARSTLVSGARSNRRHWAAPATLLRRKAVVDEEIILGTEDDAGSR